MRGIVLAAGASTRARGCKALFCCEPGSTWLERAIETQHAAGVEDVVVVVASPWEAVIRRHLGQRDRVVLVRNERPELGMWSSLRVGLDAVGVVDGPLVVSLIDHPSVDPRTLVGLIDACRTSGEDLVVRPRVRGRHGHPIVLTEGAARALARVSDAPTVKVAMARAGAWRSIDVEDLGVLEDRDGAASNLRSERDQRTDEAIAFAK